MPWTVQFTDNFARANSATVGDGWTDAIGGIWSISGDTAVAASRTTPDGFLTQAVGLADMKVDHTFTVTNANYGTATLLRAGTVSGSKVGYVGFVSAGPSFYDGRLAGSNVVNLSSPQTLPGVADGTDIVVTGTAVGTAISWSVALASSPGTPIATLTRTDSTIASGDVAVFPYYGPSIVKKVVISNDLTSVGTAYTIGLSASTGQVNAPVTLTVTPNGTYTGTITVTPNLAPTAPLTFTFSGTSAAQTASYTPTATGAYTFTPAASPALGTDPAAATYTSTAAGSGVALGAFSPLIYFNANATGFSALTDGSVQATIPNTGTSSGTNPTAAAILNGGTAATKTTVGGQPALALGMTGATGYDFYSAGSIGAVEALATAATGFSFLGLWQPTNPSVSQPTNSNYGYLLTKGNATVPSRISLKAHAYYSTAGGVELDDQYNGQVLGPTVLGDPGGGTLNLNAWNLIEAYWTPYGTPVATSTWGTFTVILNGATVCSQPMYFPAWDSGHISMGSGSGSNVTTQGYWNQWALLPGTLTASQRASLYASVNAQFGLALATPAAGATPPAAIKQTSASGSQVSLAATAPAGVTAHQWQIGTASGGPYAAIAGATGATLTLTAGTAYGGLTITPGVTYFVVDQQTSAGGTALSWEFRARVRGLNDIWHATIGDSINTNAFNLGKISTYRCNALATLQAAGQIGEIRDYNGSAFGLKASDWQPGAGGRFSGGTIGPNPTRQWVSAVDAQQQGCTDLHIQLGTNDADVADPTTPGATGISAATFQANVNAIVVAALAAGYARVWLHDFPYPQAGKGNATVLAFLASYRSALDAVAAANPGCYRGDTQYYGFSRDKYPLMYLPNDGIHPNGLGTQLAGQFQASAVYLQAHAAGATLTGRGSRRIPRGR